MSEHRSYVQPKPMAICPFRKDETPILFHFPCPSSRSIQQLAAKDFIQTTHHADILLALNGA
jgi:hypothetical protein